MAKLDAAERKDIPASDFAGPNRSFPVHDQDHVDAAARLIGRIKDPAKRAAIRKRIIAIARRKGLKVPEAWTKKKAAAMSTVDRTDLTGPVAVFDLETGVRQADGELVFVDALLFRAGSYPDKKFEMTPEELYVAAANFTTPVPVGLEHVPNVLDGALGEVREVRVSDCGTELRGIVALPADIASKIPADRRKVSCEFDRATKELTKLDLVLNPRVRDACLMAAFARPSHGTPHGRDRMQMIHDMAAQGGALCDPAKAPKFTTGRERSGLQSIHDAAVAHGASCRVMTGGRAAYSKGGGLMSFKDKVAAWFSRGMPEDFDPTADSDDADTVVLKTTAKPLLPDPEKEELKRQVAALQARQVQGDAAAFADDLIRAGKALPAERADLVTVFTRAALDDASLPAKVSFADAANKATEGTRVEALKALYSRRPAHQMTDDLLPSRRVVLSNDESDPDGTAILAERIKLANASRK